MLLLLFLGLLLLPGLAMAATVNSPTCALADVQATINSAAIGDTVHLPTCTMTTWTSTVTINKRIILEGNGTANTVIQRSAVASSENTPMFLVSGVTGFEMRQMTIDGTQDTHVNQFIDMAVNLVNCVDFRIHHMAFTDLAIAIQIEGSPLTNRGLIDNNTFTDVWYDPGTSPRGYGVAIYGNGIAHSTLPLTLGTAQNMFIEDNTFTGSRHAVASNHSSRYVFRHNTIINNRENAAAIDAHGVSSGFTGSRQYEIYENTITNAVARFAGVGMRGGDGVIFNNSFSSNITNEIRLTNDPNCSGTHPMAGQIRDLYIWGNVLNEGGAAPLVIDAACTSLLQLNRDYRTVARPGYTPYTYPHPGQGGVSPSPDVTSGLRMHLKFDEGTLTTAQDSTANNHDGTLGTGATWGLGKLGANSVSLDGTTDGLVTVTGGLTDPTSATLAAWVYPTAWPATNNDVINLRNGIILRLTASGSVRGSYYTGTGYTGVTINAGIPLNTWTHLAYTVTTSAQIVYVNGAEAGRTSSASPVVYTGLPANTLIGSHPTDPTNFRFQGLIDDARVYTRALTANDIDGLADLEDPPPLSILITIPPNSGSYSTSSALLANLGGIATDETGVTGISWNCPTCTTTAGPATCTPACGASATSVNWNIPSITFPAAGTHLITVTATDASGSRSDALTVAYAEPPVAGTCTHYASQAGGGNGLSVGSPWTVVQFLAVASAGQTLCLLDGTYTGGNSMIVPAAGRSGTTSLPITVRALNDGAVLLDGQNVRNPVVLGSTNQWWVIQGLNAKNGLTSVYEFLGSNNRGSRLIGWNATTGQANATIFTVTGTNTVVEDCAGWGDNARIIFQGSGTTSSPGSGYRRCWGEWNDAPGGTSLPGATYQPGKDQRFENVLGTVNRTGD